MAEQIPDDVMEMLPEFLQESEEHLQVLNEKMLEAERAIKGGSAMSKNDLNTMFRSAHTIKGTASFIGLKKVVALTHKAETLLQKLRDGELILTAPITDVLFLAFDKLNSLLSVLKDSKTEGVEIEVEVQRIEVILNPAGGAVSPAPVASVAAAPVFSVPPPVVKAVLAAVPAARPVPVVEASSGDSGISEKYLEQFITEVEQNIDDLNVLFLKAEQQSQDLQIVNDIFRVMHTLKGSAGLVNAKPIAELAHKMENTLQYFRAQNKPLPNEIIAVLFKGVDAVKAMNESLKTSQAIHYDSGPVGREIDKCAIKVVLQMKVAATKAVGPKEPPKVQEVNVDWAQLLAPQKAAVRVEVGQGKDAFLIEGVIAGREALKSMRLAMIAERLNKNGRLIASFPANDELDGVKTDAMVCILFCSNINEYNIREILAMDSFEIKAVEKADDSFIQMLTGDKPMEKEYVSEPAVVEPIPAAAPSLVAVPAKDQKAAVPIEISTVKIDSRKLDKLMNLSGELVIIRSQYARLVGLFNNDLTRQKDMLRMSERSTLMMVDLDKEMSILSSGGSRDLGRVQKMYDELKASIHNLYKQINNEDIVDNIQTLSETTSALEKTASDLQSGVMQTRMVPVEGVFTRFKRIVRDISKDLDKEVNLLIEGAETELDKKIVDGLGDPLTHMIRNAVDHGLEDREGREKAGKPSAGTILLRASHKGNSICIEIKDDGKGMDAQKIADIAVKKGVITEEQAGRMTDKEKLGLIFLPGFSTAQKVTGLSGRGVGMDVVRSMIASFNGVVDIDTKVGSGTSFVLKIPLTLAIIQALLVIIGGEVYALPLDSVTEIIKVPQKDVYFIDGNATVKLRDHALSLIELGKVIHVNLNKVSEGEDRRVVIVSDGENRLGVLVDALVGKDEIVIKSFTKHFSRVKGVIGASVLADGSIALILDPATIIKESR